MTFFSEISKYLEYPFVRYAIIVGTLIALASSLLGVTLILKRYSFIGDGLSHVSFGAMAVATVFSVTNDMPIVLTITMIAAIGILRMSQNSKINGDAAIAMLSVGAMAMGYLIINVWSPSNNLSGDVCVTLFGSLSILTLTKFEVYLCIVLSLIVIAIFVLMYNKLFAVTFDEQFARSTGTRVNACNTLIAIIVSVIIVLAINLVGTLLISALIVFPAISAMQVCKTFKSVTIMSAIFSVICTVLGMLIAIVAGTPVGSTIVVCDIVGFVCLYVLGKMRLAE